MPEFLPSPDGGAVAARSWRRDWPTRASGWLRSTCRARSRRGCTVSSSQSATRSRQPARTSSGERRLAAFLANLEQAAARTPDMEIRTTIRNPSWLRCRPRRWTVCSISGRRHDAISLQRYLCNALDPIIPGHQRSRARIPGPRDLPLGGTAGVRNEQARPYRRSLRPNGRQEDSDRGGKRGAGHNPGQPSLAVTKSLSPDSEYSRSRSGQPAPRATRPPGRLSRCRRPRYPSSGRGRTSRPWSTPRRGSRHERVR